MPTPPFDEHEADLAAHNERTRARLAAYLAEHSRVWIGKINIHPPAHAELVAYTGQMVHNFEADFAVPKPDPEPAAPDHRARSRRPTPAPPLMARASMKSSRTSRSWVG